MLVIVPAEGLMLLPEKMIGLGRLKRFAASLSKWLLGQTVVYLWTGLRLVPGSIVTDARLLVFVSVQS